MGAFELVEKVFFEYFLGAAHASLSVAKPWLASEVRQLSAWEGALPLPFPRFFEKNRVKLLIFRTFLYHFNASADFYVSAKLVFDSLTPIRFGWGFFAAVLAFLRVSVLIFVDFPLDFANPLAKKWKMSYD
ncbi:MAG TPA: hypothetical protein IAB37_00790, partial [Candidatus Faecivivens stercoravium]|nr:hypothetical protein [Candidatus Faecivivens stercoravium]